MRRLFVVMLAAATVAGAMVVSMARPEAQGQGQGLAVGRPDWAAAEHHDVSPPLRDIPSKPMVSTRPEFEVMRPPLNERGGQDTAIQSVAVAPFPAAFGLNFPGVGVTNYAPPDTVGEAGPNDYVQWVNVQFAVFDKATAISGAGFPKAGNSPWSGFRRRL